MATSDGEHPLAGRGKEVFFMGAAKKLNRPPSVIIAESLASTRAKSFQGNDWGRRHVAAWEDIPGPVDPGVRARERALRLAIVGWAMIAETHMMMYGSPMGDDGFLGPAWVQMGEGLRAQLNGQCGRFDCGTLDALILDISHAVGAPLEH